MKKPLLLGIILTACVVIVTFVFAQFYPEGMISYWKFDESSGTTAYDSVDANDGTLVNGPVWTSGQVGGALSFDGVNDYVTVPSNGLSSNPMTISWWMNTNDMRAALFLDKNNWYDTEGMEIWLYDNSGGYGYLNVRGSGTANVASSSDFHGEWVHVAVVFDGTTAKIYRNGAFDTSGTIEQVTTSAIDVDFIMGMLPGLSDWYLNGIIDEVAIYSRILTPEEIQQHYENGSYDVECVPSGMISWWDGDDVSETTAFDIQGGNDGTRVGGVSIIPGKVGNAFSFDGVNDYVKVSNSSNLEPLNITVDAWVKSSNPGNTGGSPRYILAKGARLCERASYALWARGSSGGIEFYISDGYFPGRFSPAAPQAAVWDGNWHHVAGTYDGNKVRLYLDGVEIGDGTPETIQIGYGDVMTTTNDLSIGRYDGTCKISYTGLLDEVEIFGRALPASEIQAIYNAGSAGKCKELVNQPPVAICQDIEISVDDNCQASITPEDVDNGSYDPDEGDTITLLIDNIGLLPLGDTGVTLTVTDENEASATCQATVTVKDTTPPIIESFTVEPNVLRPPNHKMVLITPTISDNCDSNPVFVLTSITTNEGDETDTFHPEYDLVLGDGHTTNDIQIDVDGNLFLRAERSGKGTGRIYTITYTATDASGNSATVTATVTVPHDQKK